MLFHSLLCSPNNVSWISLKIIIYSMKTPVLMGSVAAHCMPARNSFNACKWCVLDAMILEILQMESFRIIYS